MIKAIINPDAYHGKNKKSNFFEGWYFKLVQPRTGDSYCFIPGINSNKSGYAHSFIQVVKSNENKFKYLNFKEEQFKANTSDFNVKVGESTFSLSKISLDINQQYERIFGTLYFDNIVKWPDNVINPGSMGFYNYLSFMQCYSQVCAIDGDIRGKLSINGRIVDFTGGKVYIEKNWGAAFPYSYIWIQGNSFKERRGSITCSIAHVPMPFPMKSFTGFLIGIHVKGRFYKFTSMNKSSLSISCEEEKIVLKTYNKDYFLKIEGTYKQEDFMKLYAPYEGRMTPVARETLKGKLKVTLFDKRKGKMIFSDSCSSAGIEFSENYMDLIYSAIKPWC